VVVFVDDTVARFKLPSPSFSPSSFWLRRAAVTMGTAEKKTKKREPLLSCAKGPFQLIAVEGPGGRASEAQSSAEGTWRNFSPIQMELTDLTD